MDVGNMYLVRDLWKGIKGLMGGDKSHHEAPLEQQMAGGILPSFNDEAISAALDAALVHLKGPDYLDRIKEVRLALKPHQRERWRKVYGSIKLTERHEDVLSSRKQLKVEAGTKGPARDDVTEEYQRRQRDYEYTLEDPRLQHLAIVSEMARDHGVEKAKEYLVNSDFALEKSLAEQAKEKLVAAKSAAVNGLHSAIYRGVLGDGFDDIALRSPQRANETDDAYADRLAGLREDAARAQVCVERIELRELKDSRMSVASKIRVAAVVAILIAILASFLI